MLGSYTKIIKSNKELMYGYNSFTITPFNQFFIINIFQFVQTVNFHVGAENIRSQKSISKLGVKKIAEEEVTYFGEEPKLNFVYSINKEDWFLNETILQILFLQQALNVMHNLIIAVMN